MQRMVWLFPIFKATVGRWEYQKCQRFIRSLVQKRIEVRGPPAWSRRTDHKILIAEHGRRTNHPSRTSFTGS